MSTIKTKNVQVGTDGTASNNFTIYVPGTPDGTLRVGNGNAGSATDVAKIDSDGFKFTSSVQIGTDATSTNNFTIYQPSTPDGTLRIGVGNADSPTEVGRFTSSGYKPATAPLFRAYVGSTQSISNTTFTKVAFNTEIYDTNSDYDTTNYRFTPSVAGYYYVHAGIRYDGGADGIVLVSRIYKNGAVNYAFEGSSNNGDSSTQISVVVYMNGTTDYLEYYTYHNYGSATNILAGATYTAFQGHLIQQA